MTETLILPSEIPWKNLKGKDLEELLYWLFDAMGAKDLEWRIGGKGSGATDQGRDLELTFYVSSPDGELAKQRWWVESKGRTGTVEPIEVKEAVINAAGKGGIDVIVVATNSVFSNPTRDWVKEWQGEHPRPQVKLWERTQLENLCSKNPIAIIRLYGKALSAQGRMEVAKTKLWDYASFTDEPTLNRLWHARQKITISPRTLIALISSEIANGDITARSWALSVDEETLVASIGDGLINFLYLAFRANESGVRQEPIVGALAYLVLICNDRIGPDRTAKLLSDVWSTIEGHDYPAQIRKIILQPVLQLLRIQVRDVCTSDCLRVSTSRIALTEDEVEIFWQRLSLSDEEKKRDDKILTIETYDAPCKVGFSVNKDIRCPICYNENPETNILETLKILKTIADFRRIKQDDV